MGAARLSSSGVDRDRLENALVGGRDHYVAETELAARLSAITPGMAEATQDYREWIGRALRWVVTTGGVEQVITYAHLHGTDARDPAHRQIRRWARDTTVIYSGADEIALARGRALLEDDEGIHVVAGDVTDPAAAVAELQRRNIVDPGRSTALVLPPLHQITDDQAARQVVTGWAARLAAGSFLLFGHHSAPAEDCEHRRLADRLTAVLADHGIAEVYRTREQVARLVDGLDLVEPGLTHPHLWWPDGPRMLPAGTAHHLCLAVLARLPER